MKRLCYVATIPAVVHAFLRGHVQAASDHYEVTVVCNSADQHLLDGLPARLFILPVQRRPSPVADLLILFRLWALFRSHRFDVVHSIMPKTGIIAMLAAWLARVPVRIHTFTGQVWVTRHGVRRVLLKWFDTLIGALATCVLTDSPSQLDFLVSQGVLSPGKAAVIGAGSICGVDTARFHPDPGARSAVREELGIAADAILILFVGRLNHDKGMLVLAHAFASVAAQHPSAELLLVGAEEDVPFCRIQELCDASRNRLHYMGFTATPERYMAAADVFCLPSYREGFGMTIIEAAACEVPTVASRIYGITDAVEDGNTGLLVTPGDVDALVQALSTVIASSPMREQMGHAARTRALELFPSEKVTREMVLLYDRQCPGHR